jgi:hypothetical protein
VRLEVVPVTVKAARRLVKTWHRHLKISGNGLFAAGLLVDGRLSGVAVASNPARVWQKQRKFVISRVAVVEDVKNGCSKLYGAICRAGQAIGYLEAWTYTLPEEPGTSLLAAGFTDMGLTSGGEWSRTKRPRAKAVRSEPKRRWMRRLATPAERPTDGEESK